MLEQGRAFIDAVLTDESAEALPFAQVRFRSRDLLKDSDSEHGAATAVYEASVSVPMLASRKVVWLEEIERIKDSRVIGSGHPKAGRALREQLVQLVAHPPTACYFLLTAEVTRESDITAPLLRAVKAHGEVRRLVRFENETPWQEVLQSARTLGLPLERQHAEMLVDALGNDSGRLQRELEKLALYFDTPATPPPWEAWQNAIHTERHGSVFFICDKVGTCDMEGALLLLQTLQRHQGSHVPGLVIMLARHLRQLLQIKTQPRASRGESSSADAGAVKLNPFIVKRLAAQTQRFDVFELRAMLQALHEIDWAVRWRGQSEYPLLEMFIYRACRGGFRKTARFLPSPFRPPPRASVLN